MFSAIDRTPSGHFVLFIQTQFGASQMCRNEVVIDSYRRSISSGFRSQYHRTLAILGGRANQVWLL